MSRDSRTLPEMVKAWIEHEEGRTLDEILEIEGWFNAKGKQGWNPDYLAMCRAVKAALSESAPAMPFKPDRIEAYGFFDINLVFHSSRERNATYEWLARLCERD